MDKMKTMKRLERLVMAICALVVLTGLVLPREAPAGERTAAPELRP